MDLFTILVGVVLIGLTLTLGGIEKRSLKRAYRSLAIQRRRYDEERRRLLAWESDLTEWERHLDGRASSGRVPPAC